MKSVLMKSMDNVDLQIINLLQEDCRLSFSKIANKLGISAGTAFNHVKSLEKNGILKNYAAVVDSSKLGYTITAIVLIQVESGHLQEVENEIAHTANVTAVYDTTGDYNAVVISKFKNGADLNTFIKKVLSIPHVIRTATNVALNVIKEDHRIKL